NESQNWHYQAWYDNPYLIAYEKLAGEETNLMNINLSPTLKLFEGAKIIGRVGYDFYSNKYTRRNPPGIYSTRGWDANGMYSQNNVRGYSLNTDLLFNYKKDDFVIKDFDIDLNV